uniref:Uncharacterized protein n=1 Tax=Rhizophora mucronata TaxID=61149 RepID=A0A2P2PKJ6_RHIMU
MPMSSSFLHAFLLIVPFLSVSFYLHMHSFFLPSPTNLLYIYPSSAPYSFCWRAFTSDNDG